MRLGLYKGAVVNLAPDTRHDRVRCAPDVRMATSQQKGERLDVRSVFYITLMPHQGSDLRATAHHIKYRACNRRLSMIAAQRPRHEHRIYAAATRSGIKPRTARTGHMRHDCDSPFNTVRRPTSSIAIDDELGDSSQAPARAQTALVRDVMVHQHLQAAQHGGANC
jgi:hypothetical protein